MIISDSLARQYFPDADPVGQRLVLGRGLGNPFETEPIREIVGVVGDVHDRELNRAPVPTTYIPQAQVSDGLMAWIANATFMTWVVRTAGEPYALARTVGHTLEVVSQGIPVSNVRAMDDVLAQSRTRPTFNTVVFSIFGGAAWLLATIGVYGLIRYSVEQRTREIGIRIALGADTVHVRRMVIWQGMGVVWSGVVVGLLTAYALSRLLSGFLFGVGTHDPAAFVAVPVLLMIVAFIAVWLPARGACRVDPIEALRTE